MTRSWEVRLARLFYHCANPFIRCGNHFQDAQRRRLGAVWASIRDAPFDYWLTHTPGASLRDYPPGTHIPTFAELREQDIIDGWLIAEARRIWEDIAP